MVETSSSCFIEKSIQTNRNVKNMSNILNKNADIISIERMGIWFKVDPNGYKVEDYKLYNVKYFT